MVTQEQIVAWKWLKGQLNNVRDKTLRNAMLAEIRKRAIDEWEYCPDTGAVAKQRPVILDAWEKEFVEDIEKIQTYEIDVRKDKRLQLVKEAKARMRDYVVKGGKFSALPEELQNKDTACLYLDAIIAEIDACCEFLGLQTTKTDVK